MNRLFGSRLVRIAGATLAAVYVAWAEEPRVPAVARAEEPLVPAAQPLRLDRGGARVRQEVHRDSAGDVWSVRADGLYGRTGAAWEPTTVRIPPHPHWQARPAPPWASGPGCLFLGGSDGCALAVVRRDVYQDVAAAPGGERLSHHEVRRRGAERAAELGKTSWLEGYLLQDRQWTGPVPLAQVLSERRALLSRAFTSRTAPGGFFALTRAGDALWAAYGGTVYRFGPEGPPVTWTVPAADPGRRSHLTEMNLVAMPDGSVWCVTPAERWGELDATALRFENGVIRAKPVRAAAAAHPSFGSAPPHFHVSRTGQVWCWRERAGDEPAYLWKAGMWVVHDDLGRLCLEDADGRLWFLPRNRTRRFPEHPGYRVVEGERVTVFPLPAGWQPGPVTAADESTLVASYDDRSEINRRGEPGRRTPKNGVLVLTRSAAAADGVSRWTITRHYAFDEHVGAVKVFTDRFGGIVDVRGFTTKLPPPPAE